MRDFFYAFKVAALFVGTVIGAGFATGEEIKLYFSGGNLFSVVISAMLFGVFSTIFMLLGKVEGIRLGKRVKSSVRIVKSVTVFISLIAMTAAADDVIKGSIGVSGGGILTFLLCYFGLRKGEGKLGWINAVAVPIIVVFLLVVFVRCDFVLEKDGAFLPVQSLLYSSMNIFTAGMVVTKEGKNMTKRRIIFSSILIFLFVGGLMTGIKLCIGHELSDMPLLYIAKKSGVGRIAEIVIYLAIFTTMLSDVAILLPEVRRKIKFEPFVVGFFLFVVVLSNFAGFSFVVEKGYPIIGVCGVIYLIYAVLSLILSGHLFFNKRNDSIHSASKSTKYNRATHNEVKFEYLPTVNDKKTKSGF